MPTALDMVRTRFQDQLPLVLDQTLASYQAFAGLSPGLESKEFKEFHTAGRTALAHMDLLLRLMRWAEGDGAAGAETEPGDNALTGMIAEAQTALKALRAGSGAGADGEDEG